MDFLLLSCLLIFQITGALKEKTQQGVQAVSGLFVDSKFPANDSVCHFFLSFFMFLSFSSPSFSILFFDLLITLAVFDQKLSRKGYSVEEAVRDYF